MAAAVIARLSHRLNADTSIPAESEKKSVLTNTTTMRATSPGVTPPARSGIAITGKIASNA